MENLLSIVVFTPLLAALILAVFLRGDDDAARQNAKWLGLTATGATFLMALALFLSFESQTLDFQYEETRQAPFGLTYHLGVDGIALGFVMMVTALLPVTVAASWELTHRVKHFIIALLTFESLALAALTSLDIVFFVFFFEAALIPLIFLAGIWGGKSSGVAALKGWLYALPGTILLITAAVMMVRETGTTDMTDLLRHNFSTEGGGLLPGGHQGVLWLLVGLSIALKLALWPLHSWLPEVVSRASLPVGLLLACVLTKIGLYGLMRLSVAMFPVATEALAPYVLSLAGLGLVIGALAALAAEDLGRALAYVAVAQSGLLVMVTMATNAQSLDGAVMNALAHGLALGALFVLAGILEARTGSRDIAAFGALKSKVPVMSAFFLVFALSLFGLPGTPGFVGIAFATLGLIEAGSWAAFVLLFGALLLAAFAFVLHRRIMLGGLIKEGLKLMPDLNGRERVTLTLLLTATLILGLWPGLMLERTGPAFAALAQTLADLP